MPPAVHSTGKRQLVQLECGAEEAAGTDDGVVGDSSRKVGPRTLPVCTCYM